VGPTITTDHTGVTMLNHPTLDKLHAPEYVNENETLTG
jgi:hypothetical protein